MWHVKKSPDSWSKRSQRCRDSSSPATPPFQSPCLSVTPSPLLPHTFLPFLLFLSVFVYFLFHFISFDPFRPSSLALSLYFMFSWLHRCPSLLAPLAACVPKPVRASKQAGDLNALQIWLERDTCIHLPKNGERDRVLGIHFPLTVSSVWFSVGWLTTPRTLHLHADFWVCILSVLLSAWEAINLQLESLARSYSRYSM